MSGLKLTGGILRELRIHLCQKGDSSNGVRDFIQKHYVDLKKANPGFPILVRECSDVQPRLWARFDKGKEKSVSLTNMEPSDIMDQVKTFADECPK